MHGNLKNFFFFFEKNIRNLISPKIYYLNYYMILDQNKKKKSTLPKANHLYFQRYILEKLLEIKLLHETFRIISTIIIKINF